MQPAHTPGDWKVDVRFKEKGNLQAVASGVLLVPPSDALALVTDSGMPARRKPVRYSIEYSNFGACKLFFRGTAFDTQVHFPAMP